MTSQSTSRKVSCSSSSADRLGEQLVQRGLGDRTPSETGDDVIDRQREARQREPHVLADDAADADRERLLQHDHAPGALERLAHLRERVRAEALDGETSDRFALLAQLVHDVLDRPQHRAEGDDDRLRVLGAVAAHQPAGGPAEGLLEVVGEARNRLQGLELLRVHEVLDLAERVRAHHGADRHRLGRVEHHARLEAREERVHLLLRRHVHALDGVGEDEAVHADHHRQRQLLGQPEGLDVQVERLLVVLGIELDPARVALGHGVAVVVPDVDRRRRVARLATVITIGRPSPAAL